jgi:hypothetical protein
MTTSADLIAAFEDRIVVPIDLNEVAKWLLDRSIQDEINFVPADLDTGVIRGFLRRFRRAKGGWDIDPDEVSNIHYDREQGPMWINLVCAKELLHILDAARCATKEEYERLTSSLALPNELQYLLADPDFAFADKMGDLPASALVLPMAVRELLLPAYKADVLTDDAIAELVMMPAEHVRAVMSDRWPAVYEIIMSKRTPDDDEDEPTLGL